MNLATQPSKRKCKQYPEKENDKLVESPVEKEASTPLCFVVATCRALHSSQYEISNMGYIISDHFVKWLNHFYKIKTSRLFYWMNI